MMCVVCDEEMELVEECDKNGDEVWECQDCGEVEIR